MNNVYDPQNDVRRFGVEEVKLLRKALAHDGWSIVEDEEFDPSKKSFIDDSEKIVFNNAAPYGHVTTIWLYLLLTELRASPGPKTVIMNQSPSTRQMRMEHSSNLTEYLEQRLIEKGHRVEYADTDDFYINNFILYMTPIHVNATNMKIVSDFLSEGLDYSKPPTTKVYISRGKTTTYNGNRLNPLPDHYELHNEELKNIRDSDMYRFSDRIDDEQALEEYLRTLGFIIYYPEDTESYKDQLQLFASSKIVMSATSSALSVCSVMPPNTFIVELATPLYAQVDSQGEWVEASMYFHDIYKNIATIKNKLYLAISNKYRKTAEVIEQIEGSPDLKALLSS